jgi:hypothetical protein
VQHEIKTSDTLLDASGFLKHKGYSKRPVLTYNPENIKIYPLRFLNRLRLKEWDYYGVTTQDFFFSATVAHIGYAGFVFVYFIDFREKSMVEETVLTPFGRGCRLPRSSETGDIFFRHRKGSISFEHRGDLRTTRVDCPGFNGGAGLSADIIAHQPIALESIVVSTPIGGNRFYYNQKINCMPTEGKITLGRKEYRLTPTDALTTLDWGRGVWEYNSFWNWASASGFLSDGTTVGVNMGAGFGDLSSATENCFFLQGKMTKLEGIAFDYDRSDYMRPWRFSSDDGKLELTFQPFFERVAKTNVLVIKSAVHQLFGMYSGTLTTDAGQRVAVRDVVGWAEEHTARW